jgi:hypothetical protein
MGRYVDVRMRPVYYIICDLFWLSGCFWDGSNPRDLLLILMASFDLSRRYILLFDTNVNYCSFTAYQFTSTAYVASRLRNTLERGMSSI